MRALVKTGIARTCCSQDVGAVCLPSPPWETAHRSPIRDANAATRWSRDESRALAVFQNRSYNAEYCVSIVLGRMRGAGLAQVIENLSISQHSLNDSLFRYAGKCILKPQLETLTVAYAHQVPCRATAEEAGNSTPAHVSEERSTLSRFIGLANITVFLFLQS